MADAAPMLFVPVGDNPAEPFGMDARDRACRLASEAGFKCAEEVQPGSPHLLANMAYAWDPIWLGLLAKKPKTVLSLGGKPVLASVPADEDAKAAASAIAHGEAISGYEELAAEAATADFAPREIPFVLPLDPGHPEPVERAAYDAAYLAAYEGAADALTLYLWRRPAFFLTRWAARLHLSPNLVTGLGAAFCVLAFTLFWSGEYWLGILFGFSFMILDIVDGKLARCTGASSKLGKVVDKGIDLIHPPFWWWAWLHGLYAYGRPLAPFHATMVLWIILGGYAGERIIEATSMKRFDGMDVHLWRPLDSKFRLVGAASSPNLLILSASLLFRRPDMGLEMVAWWTLISLIFHGVRLAQMTELKARGGKVRSWLRP